MSSRTLSSQPRTLNSKVGAIALAAGAFLTLVLSHTSASLAPLRLLTIAVSAFAASCFCDEMGMRKPLNRAGFVFFVIALGSRSQVILGGTGAATGRYELLFAGFLLAALLFWSIALLHRQRTLKVVGAVGLVASLTPIVALIVGHLAIGAGAVLGVSGVLAAAHGAPSSDHGFPILVERMFGLWGYVVAWLLWRGQIQASRQVA